MNQVELLLVRHGETDDNARGVFQGQAGRSLSAHGRDQAARLARRMASWGLGPVPMWSSDLERAVETSRILGAELGLEPALDEGLREVDVGAWTGLTEAEAAARFPEEHAAWALGLDVRRGGGETYAELGERVGSALLRIAEAARTGRVLVVSHGAAIRSVAGHLTGLGAQGLKALAAVRNTSVTVLRVDGRHQARIVAYNDAAHLEG